MVATGRNDTPCMALQLVDVATVAGKIQMNIRKSKTDQIGRGTNITLGSCSIREICPVSALELYLT